MKNTPYPKNDLPDPTTMTMDEFVRVCQKFAGMYETDRVRRETQAVMDKPYTYEPDGGHLKAGPNY